MRVNSHRFGQIDVPRQTILHFPDGMLGFPHLRRGCLLPYGPNAGLRCLQSLEDPALLFLTVEPYIVFPQYEVELTDADAIALELGKPEHAAVLTLITISKDGEAVTTNLLAPIVINTLTRRARQVILDTDRYLTKHLIGARIKEDLNAGVGPQTR